MSADQSADSVPRTDLIRLFLCGDVMTGRGIDQVLPHPNDPALHEPFIDDARFYLKLAESVNGAITRPVTAEYIWGDALAELDRFGVDLRITILRPASLLARTTGATGRSITACIRRALTASPRRTSTAAASRTIISSTGATTAWPRHCARSTQRASPTRVRVATPQRLPHRRCLTSPEKAACSSSRMPRRRAAFHGNGPRPRTGRASIFCKTLRRKLRAASRVRCIDSTASAM